MVHTNGNEGKKALVTMLEKRAETTNTRPMVPRKLSCQHKADATSMRQYMDVLYRKFFDSSGMAENSWPMPMPTNEKAVADIASTI